MEIGKVYQGFKVLEFAFIEEVNSNCFLMEHVKSGARLFYMANDDDNKVFSIGFRTPPFDDSGVAHILEHSVLCGSRKYRLKEPFVELAKGSLNTFLNAMTYPDKTVYPVASRNDKDFANLMDVYLDAVFYPLIYENPYTLRQEGWHYEISDAAAALQYNGVVYNEMKGVYSSPDAYLENETMKALFPDNVYHFESGGYPANIPELTQEKFLQFHKTYYSPENSYIFLYGDMDIENTLAHLDGYLKDFDKTGKVHSEIALQEPFAKTKEVVAYYPVAKDSDLKNKVYHELSIVVGQSTDYATATALRLLEDVLLESESGPLRRALVDAGIGQNVGGNISQSLLQPIFSISVSGSEADKKDEFVSVIYRELERLMSQGIDKKLLEAALNGSDFKLRESDFGAYPKGLVYGLSIMDVWIYEGSPFEILRFKKRQAQLREGLKTNYYEQLIETYLLDNTHKVLVTLLPQPGKQEADSAAEAEKMAELKATMTKEVLDRHIAECEELHRRQAAEDSPEALASIPVLKRSDIRKDIVKAELDIKKDGQNQYVYRHLHTSGIVYLDWEFDVTGIDAKLLPYLNLFADVFGKFDTEEYSYQNLTTEVIMHTGGMGCSTVALSDYKNADKYTIQVSVKGKVLVEKLPKFYELLQSVLFHTKFDNKQRFKEVVEELKTGWDDNFFAKGMTVALSRLYSYCGDAARVNEYASFAYYQFLKDLCEHFAEKADETLEILASMPRECYNKTKFSCFYSCDAQDRAMVEKSIHDFVEHLPESKWAGKEPCVPKLLQTNEAITAPGKVQYVIAGGNFVKHGFKYTGAMRVLMTILSYDYLWNRVRVLGGAYGSSGRFSSNGLMAFTSYRDPQLSKTLTVYRELADWLRQRNFTEQELDKFVIGTMSSLDIPLTNSMKIERTANKILKHVTDEDLQKERDEVLAVTNEDLVKLADVVETVLKDNLLCVVGGKTVIEENKTLFNEVLDM